MSARFKSMFWIRGSGSLGPRILELRSDDLGQKFLHRTVHLVEGSVGEADGGRIRVGDRDAAESFAADDSGRLVVAPSRIIQIIPGASRAASG